VSGLLAPERLSRDWRIIGENVSVKSGAIVMPRPQLGSWVLVPCAQSVTHYSHIGGKILLQFDLSRRRIVLHNASGMHHTNRPKTPLSASLPFPPRG